MWLPSIALAVVLVAGGAWYAYPRYFAAQAAPAPALKTASVRAGDIVLSASGTGSVVPLQETRFAFKSTGRLVAVNVKPGSMVTAGQVLAQVDDAAAKSQIVQAEIARRLAEIELEEIAAGADPAALASSQAGLAGAEAELAKLVTSPSAQDLAAAEANLVSARDAQSALLAGPTAADRETARIDLETAKQNLDQAMNRLWQAQTKRDGVAGDRKNPQYLVDAAEADVAVALTGVDQAQGAYEKAKLSLEAKLAGPTEEQLSAARAKVSQAQAALDNLKRGADPAAVAAAKSKIAQAQAQLDATLAGASVRDLEAAELAVDQAKNSLANALADLENTFLRAPFAGTVTEVSASVGEATGTAPIVTVADLAQPLVRFYVEETDLALVKPTLPVEVTLDALPDVVIGGEVKGLSPALVTRDGVPSAEVVAQLKAADAAKANLLVGMGAEVKVTAASAKGVLVVPQEALRPLGPGRYGVFVVGPSGELELRPVEVGLQDQTLAEIKSGLAKGEVVSTGTVATK